MPGVNKVILIGHLGKDPELRNTQGGASVASFSMATSEKWKDANGEMQEKTEWHNIVLWMKLAETAVKYLVKGSLVYIEGRIQTRKWEDKDGQTRYTTEIIGQRMNMLGGKTAGNDEPDPKPEKTDDDLPF